MSKKTQKWIEETNLQKGKKVEVINENSHFYKWTGVCEKPGSGRTGGTGWYVRFENGQLAYIDYGYRFLEEWRKS